MSDMVGKKSKKLPKPFRKHIFLGVPTNIAAGPLGFRAELDTNLIDENSPGPSRIVFHNKNEDQDLHASETSTTGGVIDHGTEHRNDLAEENSDDAKVEESGPAEAIRVPERDQKGTVDGAVSIPVNVAEEAPDRLGLLQASLGAISAVYAKYQEKIVARNKIEDLLSRIVALEARFATLPGDVREQRRRHDLIRKLKDIEGQLRSLCEKPGLEQLTDRIQDDESVLGLLEDLRETISNYQMIQRTMKYEQECKAIDSVEANVLNQFRSAKEAEHRHGERRGCLKGTRRDILDEIEHWSRDFDKPPVYWLNGLAGTGKTTIAQTIAERLFADDHLGASFFCSRDFEDRSNLHFIFPTLAVQLARRYIEFRSVFVPLARSDPGIAYESLYNQMNKLIVRPLVESDISTVIVIDALDECKDAEPASAILSVLGQFVSQIPKVKIFTTGRPEPRVREGFHLPLLTQATDVFVLHEVESSQVNSDIRQFFKHKLSELAGRRRGLDDWPTEEQLDQLYGRAAGLFVYAVATVRSIDHKSSSPRKQLDRLLESPESSVFEGKTKFTANTTLDSLYASILQDAFGDNYPEDDAKVRSVLGAVTLAANPLSPSAIAALLGLDIEEVFPLLTLVHSLLALQDDVDQPVRSFHKSFPDFIVDPARCTNSRFRVSPPDQHAELLVGCLELMNQRLEQNMCKLPDGVMNSEVDNLKERTERYIHKALRYACTSWHKHLVETTPAHKLKITSVLHRFLEQKFIFWLEILSVLGAAREAVDAMEVAARWLDVSPTLDLINDYFRFVIGFFEVINVSAPHIYHSALPLSPQESIVRKLYRLYLRPLVRVVRGLPTSWEPAVTTVRHSNQVKETAWSPCNRFIAVALPEAVEILDAATLERLHIFIYPRAEELRWLSFSPDSRSLTQFTSYTGHTTWDLQTGGRISIVPSTPNPFCSQYFSSTYSMDGKIVGVAYRDWDTTATCNGTIIATYNLLSGTHICSHRVSEGQIVASIWTHGEFIRFAAVKPGSITIWEVGFTSEHTLAEIESFPAMDNIDPSSCRFLPTSARLAFTLDKAVLIWNARDSKILLNSVVSGGPTLSSFSSDGRFFAYGTAGQEFHLWKESPTGYVLHRKLASDIGGGLSVMPLLSPNGESIVVSSHSGTQLWRTTDPITSLHIVPIQSPYIFDFTLVFSPDRLLAATARLWEDTVTIIDLKSGDPRLIINTDMGISALGMNANTVIVAGYSTIVTWDLPPGDCVLNARVNIHDSVRTIHATPLPKQLFAASVSPDFDYFVITQGLDNGLDLYDISTGKHVCTTSGSGHRPWFTQDGREVWSSRSGSMEGWKMVRGGKSDDIVLEPLGPNAKPSGGYRWESSHGHDITNDGWILDSRRKRVMWLPHRWRVHEEMRIWDGQFLGLLDGRPPEPVILELDE